jgi:hypothetical protein
VCEVSVDATLTKMKAGTLFAQGQGAPVNLTYDRAHDETTERLIDTGHKSSHDGRAQVKEERHEEVVSWDAVRSFCPTQRMRFVRERHPL